MKNGPVELGREPAAGPLDDGEVRGAQHGLPKNPRGATPYKGSAAHTSLTSSTLRLSSPIRLRLCFLQLSVSSSSTTHIASPKPRSKQWPAKRGRSGVREVASATWGVVGRCAWTRNGCRRPAPKKIWKSKSRRVSCRIRQPRDGAQPLVSHSRHRRMSMIWCCSSILFAAALAFLCIHSCGSF